MSIVLALDDAVLAPSMRAWPLEALVGESKLLNEDFGIGVPIVVAIVGCYNYYRLKHIEYADSWDWSKFIWGVQQCKKLA